MCTVYLRHLCSCSDLYKFSFNAFDSELNSLRLFSLATLIERLFQNIAPLIIRNFLVIFSLNFIHGQFISTCSCANIVL